jgi:hypothetical protein
MAVGEGDMIKFMQCVRSRPEIGLHEFRRYWQQYEERLLRVGELSGAVRVTIDTTLAVDANLQVMTARGTAPPFEGVAEIWWERAPDFARLESEPELRAAMGAFRSLQAEFIDLERSTFFFAAGRDLLGGDSTA